jgi:thiamine biosynthesis lipoprotein
LFSALRFALHVAAASGGAFDPTIGAVVSEAGFNRNYRTGELAVAAGSPDGSYKDVLFGPGMTTVRLLRPLQLDLGAVAKGLAVDLAARELAPAPEGRLLIVGAGVQGRAHLEAFAQGLGVREVRVASRPARLRFAGGDVRP